MKATFSPIKNDANRENKFKEFIENAREELKCCQCRISGHQCSRSETINCFLREKYLEAGLWTWAQRSDMTDELSDNLSAQINKRILERLNTSKYD